MTRAALRKHVELDDLAPLENYGEMELEEIFAVSVCSCSCVTHISVCVCVPCLRACCSQVVGDGDDNDDETIEEVGTLTLNKIPAACCMPKKYVFPMSDFTKHAKKKRKK